MPLQLDIVTPDGVAYEGEVDSVVLPGSEGDFGVLPGHERFLCPVTYGEVAIRAGGRPVYAALSAGFAEVSGDRVAVLVDTCELAGDIDAARARRDHARAVQALEELQAQGGSDVELARLHGQRESARVRMEVAERRA